MEGSQTGPASAEMQLPERIDYEWLRSQATKPREARLETLLAERKDDLSDLFIALRDKSRPSDFESGLKGRKRRKLVREGKPEPEQAAGVEEFLRRYQDAQTLREIDLSLPPLSPSPPPISPGKGKATDETLAPVEDEEEDLDAEGEDEDEEMAVAEALAPGVAVSHSAATASQASDTTPTVSAPAPVSALSTPKPTQTAIPRSSPLRSHPLPTTAPSATSMVASSSETAPTEVAARPSQPPTIAGQLTNANASAHNQSAALPPPYDSLFGIASISSNYAQTIPPVSQDIL